MPTKNLNSAWIVTNEAIFSKRFHYLFSVFLFRIHFERISVKEIYIKFKRCTCVPIQAIHFIPIFSLFAFLLHYFSLVNSIAEGFPDPRTCLLHQKLQMLNICINRRRIREGNLSHSMAKSNQQNRDSRSDESDDEFFDCDATNVDDASEQTQEYLPWNKPEGRLSKLNDMKLIDSDEYLYVPITQEPVPKTEDQLEDDAEILLKLGPESGKLKTICVCWNLFLFSKRLNKVKNIFNGNPS